MREDHWLELALDLVTVLPRQHVHLFLVVAKLAYVSLRTWTHMDAHLKQRSTCLTTLISQTPIG